MPPAGHGRPWPSPRWAPPSSRQLSAPGARPGTLANPALLWAVAGALGLQFAALYLPFLNAAVEYQATTALDLLVVFGVVHPGYAAVRLDRVTHKDGRWRARHRTPADPRGASDGETSTRPHPRVQNRERVTRAGTLRPRADPARTQSHSQQLSRGWGSARSCVRYPKGDDEFADALPRARLDPLQDLRVSGRRGAYNSQPEMT